MKSKLQFLVVIVLVLSVFFRFDNLDKKVYWGDETFTSLRISGYTVREAVQQLSQKQLISVQDLQKYQRPNPEKDWTDTIKSVALEDANQPPLYYVMLRLWTQWFGSSVTVMRSWSAVISLLTFPCIYWLCLELFESPLVGWVAIALIATSPFQMLYAQEARVYSFWTVTILLSSASLLRAMRLKTKGSWFIYAATVVLGFYSHLFFTLVAIGHAIYVVAIESFRWSKTVSAYLLAAVAGLLTFTPWIWAVITNMAGINATTSWQSESVREPLLSLVKKWAINITRDFIDVGFDADTPFTYLILFIPLFLIVLSLVGYSIYFLCLQTPKRVWLFILTLMGVPALALILPDLILGGHRSSLTRYLMPCHLGDQLAVAYFLATQITFTVNRWRQKLWQLILILLLSTGVLSCALSSQAQRWWHQGLGYQNPPIARIINKASRPLVISEINKDIIFNVFSLSYLLAPDLRLQFLVQPTADQIPNGFSDLFLYGIAKALRAELEKEQNLKIEPVYEEKRYKQIWLWKIIKQ